MRKPKGKDQYVKVVEYSHTLEKLLIMERENTSALRAELESADRERDELLQRMSNAKIEREEEKRLHEEGAFMLCGQYDDLAAAMGWSSKLAERQGVSQLEYARQLNSRVIDLEAEIARRDAAVGEPFAYVDSSHLDEFGWGYVFKQSSPMRAGCKFPVYAAAPSAVLPSEKVINASTDGGRLCRYQGYNEALRDVRALGAKQQKVVELYKRKSMEVISGQRYSYVLLEDLLPELDAAGVKWEVKK